MTDELNGYEVKKVERLARGLYLAVCKSKFTGINSARLVSIPLENEAKAFERKDCSEVLEIITKAALESIVLNYDESEECNTVEVSFTDDEYAKLEKWCEERKLTPYALFKGVNLFLCDPANKECILRIFSSFMTADGINSIKIDLEK